MIKDTVSAVSWWRHASIVSHELNLKIKFADFPTLRKKYLKISIASDLWKAQP